MAGAGMSFSHTNMEATTAYDISRDLDSSSSGSNMEGILHGNFQQVKKKRKKSNSKGHVESNGNVGNSNVPRETDMEGIANQRGDIRKRLYFPNDLEMDFNAKLQWTVKLYKQRQSFEALFKEGKYKPYITVKDEEAANFLTTTGFDGVIMEKPDDREQGKKVIIFNHPLVLDPQDLLIDDRFIWVKRREVKIQGNMQQKPQLIALMKGDIPEKVFVPCLGYRNIALYNEAPIMCYKCSKWGHMAYKCQSSYKCRYCSGNHDSKICGDKIKENECIVPRCCNCGESHNANSWSCKKRPQFGQPKQNLNKRSETHIITTVNEGPGLPPDPHPHPVTSTANVWEERQKTRRRADAQNLNDSVQQGNSVINAHKEEIDALKKLVLELKSQIVSNARLTDVKNVCICNKGEKCKKGNGNVVMNEVTSVLDNIIQFIQNPVVDNKKSILMKIKAVRGKIHNKDG